MSKKSIIELWKRLRQNPASNLTDLVSENLVYHNSAPIYEVNGLEKVQNDVFAPLLASFPDLERRDDILMEGDFSTGHWVAACGFYCARWNKDYLTIPATNHLTFLRYGEFYRFEAGKIVEMRFLHDFIDLMRQAGVNPLPKSAGIDGILPSPQPHNGVFFRKSSSKATKKSLDLVEDMIFGGLRKFDGSSLKSMGMERYWHEDMLWYGPAGIGANRGINGFQTFHQRPFLHAFPDRVGGNHRARFADGMFVASTGWPSINATHKGDYLGHPATNKPITQRVMDFWRRDGDLLAENWVFIDLIDLFSQFDRDLMAEMRNLKPKPQ